MNNKDMPQWETDIEKNPPQEGVLVEIKWDCCWGDCTATARRVSYKRGSSKSQLRRGWRFVGEHDVYYKDQITGWRPLSGAALAELEKRNGT